MNTDRFTDSIRRKLESIRPEFTEKDWTRMQASLQSGVPQSGSPTPGQPFSGVWTAKPWLLAVATVSTAVLIAVSVWQRREINHLRQTISQLSKHPTHQTTPKSSDFTAPKADAPAYTHSEGAKSQVTQEETLTSTSSAPKRALPIQHDTVYVTQHVAVPSRLVPPEGVHSTERAARSTEQGYATSNRAPVLKDQPNQLDKVTHNPKADEYGALSTPSSAVRKNSVNSSVATTQSANPFVKERGAQSGYAKSRETKSRNVSPLNSVANPTNNVTKTTPGLSGPPVESNGTSANYERVNRLSIATPTINWQNALAQRARRMRPAQAPTVVYQVVEQPQAPASQPAQRVTKGIRFRAGLGGEVASHLTSFGVFTDVLLSSHWTLGVGLSQTTYIGRFINDYDFDVRTRRDFRREFAHGIDPRREILNIDTRTTRLQIPVSIGYRIPLTKTLTLLPTVGTYLNLNSTESAMYYCPVAVPQRGVEELHFSASPTVDLINTLALSAGLEWQRGHWVVQSSPVLTLPMQAAPKPFQPEPNWQNSTTVGLRARLLYQF